MEIKYIIYRIINLINNKIYVGAHTTQNVDDDYMGSGIAIGKAIKKYGINIFKKEILFQCPTKESMYEIEKEIVNEEFIKRKDTYNMTLGGRGSWEHCKGKIIVQDRTGKKMSVDKKDPRYLNGELISPTIGLISVKDKDNNHFQVSKNDPRYLNGELVGVSKGMLMTKDKNGNKFCVSLLDPRYINGELVSCSKDRKHTNATKKKISNIHAGTILVKSANNSNEKPFRINVNDPRYLSGEVIPANKGIKRSEEDRLKMKLGWKLRQEKYA